MNSEERIYGIKELPPFSVPVPDYPDWYVRYTTLEIGDLCRKLGCANPLELLTKLDAINVDAIHECWRVGLKKIPEKTESPRWESMPLTAARDLILDALCLRLFGKTNKQLQEEAAPRFAGVVQPWTGANEKPVDPEQRERRTLDDVSTLG